MKLSLVLPICLSFVIISQAAPMNFDKRRFGVEHTPEADATFQEVKDLAQGSDKEAQAGNLSGAMVRALLAKAPACDQQDRADEVIDLGKEFGGEKLKQYIKVAQTYRQLERNTPGVGQPSELCDKKPRNKELEGLTQAQDPTDPEKEDPEKEDPEKEDPENEEEPETDGENVAETDPVGGVKMPKIQQENGDFIVNGNGFNGNLDAAHSRQCDIQKNLCFNKFNGGDRSFSGQDCEDQVNKCKEGPPVFA
ncbi:hypothetical protein C1646_743781 [Rhizophagus diaphanus]|nr:hypothetical protein C1646_743781 [Rhizophagus diaphanus] [Rhizophagus sp. MUCL 43196]